MRRMSGQRNFAWIEGGVECRWNAAADLSGSTGQRRPCGNRTDSCSSGNGKRFSGIRRSTSDSHRRRNSSPSLCSLKSCFSSSSLYFLLLFGASRAFKGADAHPLETLQSGVSSGARQPPLNAQRRSKSRTKGTTQCLIQRKTIMLAIYSCRTKQTRRLAGGDDSRAHHGGAGGIHNGARNRRRVYLRKGWQARK